MPVDPFTKLSMGANNEIEISAWFDDVPQSKPDEVGVFTIYHIVGLKCGCTDDLKRLAWQHQREGELRSLEVIEIVNGTPQQAGDVEWAWADRYGYPRGKHYSKFNWALTVSKEMQRENGKNYGWKGGRAAVKNMNAKNAKLTKEQRSKIGRIGGKVWGRKAVETGQLASIQSMGGKARAKVMNALRDHCETHGIICAPHHMGNHRKKHPDGSCVIGRLSPSQP